jgi:hypothetical protein
LRAVAPGYAFGPRCFPTQFIFERGGNRDLLARATFRIVIWWPLLLALFSVGASLLRR